MKSPQKPIPRVSPKKASKGFQWPKRSRIKKKPRKPSETLRIYGGKKRIEFVKSLPCAACHVEGYSENAHVLGNGGMGRKADYQTIAPLCTSRYWKLPNEFWGGEIGCHPLFDQHRIEFRMKHPDFNPSIAAYETENLWLEHSKEKA